MSKKLAAGADVIVLDVKSGSGSFMKTAEDAQELAENLTAVGKLAGKKTVAVITDMDEPLGNAIGNALEVKEAIQVLHGEKQGELLELGRRATDVRFSIPHCCRRHPFNLKRCATARAM